MAEGGSTRGRVVGTSDGSPGDLGGLFDIVGVVIGPIVSEGFCLAVMTFVEVTCHRG